MINKDIVISKTISLMDAVAVMDRVNHKALVVCKEDVFIGVVSIGDVQRALLNKKDLNLPVSEFVRSKITYAFINDDLDVIKDKMYKEKIEIMPIVDEDHRLVDIIEWDQLFVDKFHRANQEPLNLPVVIMAGGKGTRLRPLTNIIPKPLIPISEKTIIEEIMEKFVTFGCTHFYISLNYKKDEIKKYFMDKKWNIEYVYENSPLGTAGSLYYLKDKLNSTFFVINCDTLVDVNMQDLITYHKTNNNMVTVVSAVKSIHIPYGSLETGFRGMVKEIKEKPEYVYQVNCGLYVLEPAALDYIKKDQFLNITDLINKLIEKDKMIGAFPVSEGSWVDMGNWEAYLKVVNNYLQSRQRVL